ncbi:hypothetical protein LTR08_001646 [Meristemomyces frigidus]|nr:hypothetical protein LTR08_001646 [Meristemomyces frigidus]
MSLRGKIPVTNSPHAVVSALEKAFSLSLAKSKIGLKKRGDSSQYDIASERLCDDTIEYLAPTLEQHKGCTLIDLHPGACVWSSKLHDYLQPKRHLLLEPEANYYEPFIKPLLDRPGSTYRHSTLGAHPTRHLTSWGQIMDDPELLPPRPKLFLDDPQRREYDPSMLLIGNLARSYGVQRRQNSVNYSTMILQQLTWAMLDGNLLHTDGRVRMLMWAPEAEAYLLFPQSEASRHNTNVAMSMAASTTKVVGVHPPYELGGVFNTRRRGRVRVMDELVSARVERLMREKGMQRPEGREFLTTGMSARLLVEEIDKEIAVEAQATNEETVITRAEVPKAAAKTEGLEVEAQQREQQAASGKAEEHGDASAMLEVEAVDPLLPTISTARELHAALDDARTRLASLKIGVGARSHGHKVVKKEKALLDTLHYPQSVPVANFYVNAKARVSVVALLVDMNLRIVNLEASLKFLEEEGSDQTDLASLRDGILALDDECSVWAGKKMKEYVDGSIDGQVSFFSSPPLIPDECRQYEALKADSDEFWPSTSLMLLELMPKDRDLSVPGLASAGEGVKVCKMLGTALMSLRAQPLPIALERLAPNAAQDLIPLVPAITDPRLGGRLNPNNVRARMVTDQMLDGLVKAWAEWPFKPSTLELELAAESARHAGESAEAAEESTGQIFSEN